MVNLGTRLDNDTRKVLVSELKRNHFFDLAGRVEAAPDGLLVNVIGKEDFWLIVKLYNERIIHMGRGRRRLKYGFGDGL